MKEKKLTPNSHLMCSRLHHHTPFEQSREVVLVDAVLSDHAEMGGKQGQSDGQQVCFITQTVLEHPAGYQAHQVNLRDQPEVSHDQSLPQLPIPQRFESVFLPCEYQPEGPFCTDSPSVSHTSPTLPAFSACTWKIISRLFFKENRQEFLYALKILILQLLTYTSWI